MTSWRRRFLQALAIMLAVILVAGMVLYMRVKHAPLFYDKALLTSPLELDHSRQELLEKVEQLKQDVRFSPSSEITLSDAQLNGWLAENYDSNSDIFSASCSALPP